MEPMDFQIVISSQNQLSYLGLLYCNLYINKLESSLFFNCEKIILKYENLISTWVFHF